MKLSDTNVIPFGQHKGKRLKDIPAAYLLWLLDEEWCRKQYPDLITYIRENKKLLEMEAWEEEDEPDFNDD